MQTALAYERWLFLGQGGKDVGQPGNFQLKFQFDFAFSWIDNPQDYLLLSYVSVLSDTDYQIPVSYFTIALLS